MARLEYNIQLVTILELKHDNAPVRQVHLLQAIRHVLIVRQSDLIRENVVSPRFLSQEPPAWC